MKTQPKLHRRSVLNGLGVSLALPCLEIMGEDAQQQQANIKRSCFMYTSNGVSLPPVNNPIHKDWYWFPHGKGSNYNFTKTNESLKPFKNKLTFVGGLHHPKARLSDVHNCSDIWMTGADLSGATYNNTTSADQVIAEQVKSETRFSHLTLSSDGGVGYKSRIATMSFDRNGRPIPSENNLRRIFTRLFKQETSDKATQKKNLNYEAKVVDMVLNSAKLLDKRLGKNDRHKMDQYLTSMSEIENNIKRNLDWIDTPVKQVDTSHLQLDQEMTADPNLFYNTMFDMISLAFEADLTRTVTFMLNREDGMGLADSFPTILFKIGGHHSLSHSGSKKDGYKNWAKYDQFLLSKLAHFMKRLDEKKEGDSTILDNSILLYGSGCSTIHNFKNLPIIVAGGKNLGLKHGSHIVYKEGTPMNNMHYSIIKSMGVDIKEFGDGKETLSEIFS